MPLGNVADPPSCGAVTGPFRAGHMCGGEGDLAVGKRSEVTGNGTGSSSGGPSSGRRRRRSVGSERSVRLDAPTRGDLRRSRRQVGSGRRPRRATSPLERGAIWGLAGAAAVGGALAGAHPTGTAGVDQLLAGATAGVVTLAASRAQRWTWQWVCCR